MQQHLPEAWRVWCRSPSFIDVASFGALSRYTCGQLYYYPGFHPDRDGARVEAEARLMHDPVVLATFLVSHDWECVCLL